MTCALPTCHRNGSHTPINLSLWLMTNDDERWKNNNIGSEPMFDNDLKPVTKVSTNIVDQY